MSTTLKSTLPKFLNRKSKWKYEVMKTNTLSKWYNLIRRIRGDPGMDESVQEEILQNLLADILAAHENARELEDYFSFFGFFDLSSDGENLEAACICGECL